MHPRATSIGRSAGCSRRGVAVGLTDGELLERFASTDSDSAESAFETILARHGSTVLTVCRQVLGDAHAAEDAFQATFLVLVRRAGSLRVHEGRSLGPWLYGVAYRTALKARRCNVRRRRAREHRAAVPEARAGQGATTVERDDLGAALHEEVNRLPTRYRAPVVLCYFEGRTHDEAAAALNWPVGTVRSCLSRARELLRSRLARRGLAPAGWTVASWFDGAARADVPSALKDATLTAAIQGTPAAAVDSLVGLVLRSLFIARFRTAAAAVGLVLMTVGVGAIAAGSRRGRSRPRPPGSRPDLRGRPRSMVLPRRCRNTPGAAGDLRVPPRRRRQSGCLHPRWQVPGHDRLEAGHRRLGCVHGPAGSRDGPVGRPLRPDRPLARWYHAGDDRARPRPTAPALGPGHRAASVGAGMCRKTRSARPPPSRPTAGLSSRMGTITIRRRHDGSRSSSCGMSPRRRKDLDGSSETAGSLLADFEIRPGRQDPIALMTGGNPETSIGLWTSPTAAGGRESRSRGPTSDRSPSRRTASGWRPRSTTGRSGSTTRRTVGSDCRGWGKGRRIRKDLRERGSPPMAGRG